MSNLPPSPGLIRQQLRILLQERILPELRSQTNVRLLGAQWPLALPEDVHCRDLPVPLLREEDAVNVYPWGLRWADLDIHAIPYPVLCCVVAGEIDLRLGITPNMLPSGNRQREHCGAQVLALPATSYLAIPARVPYPTGTLLPWEREEPQLQPALIFWVRLLPTGALCHTTTVFGGEQTPGYSLLIEDGLLASMMEILLSALQPPRRNLEMARAQLLVLYLRLLQGLQQSMPMLTDGIHSRFPAGTMEKPVMEHSREDSDAAPDAAPTSPPVARSSLSLGPTLPSPSVEKACAFIQLHLHEPLTPVDVARHLRLKPAQLNRLFRRHLDVSVMRYVLHQRMETARLLLQNSELSVQEIGRLVGYRYTSHFSRNFQEHTGVPPLKFRQQNAASPALFPPPLPNRSPDAGPKPA